MRVIDCDATSKSVSRAGSISIRNILVAAHSRRIPEDTCFGTTMRLGSSITATFFSLRIRR